MTTSVKTEISGTRETLTWATLGTVYVLDRFPGDQAHPAGYASVSWTPDGARPFTIPLDQADAAVV